MKFSRLISANLILAMAIFCSNYANSCAKGEVNCAAGTVSSNCDGCYAERAACVWTDLSHKRTHWECRR